MALPVWLKEKLFQKPGLVRALKSLSPLVAVLKKSSNFAEHRLSHAASAFFPSPFNEAVVLTLDGVGEWATTFGRIGRGRTLRMVKEIRWPHSLGVLYSAFTYYTGFKVNSGEYKVDRPGALWRAGDVDLIMDHVIDVKSDGSSWLDQRYFKTSWNPP